MNGRSRHLGSALAALLMILAPGPAPRAQEPPPPPGDEAPPEQAEAARPRTPVRLSFTRGEVSFWRPGAEDWGPAQINTPLAPGDALYAAQAASLELQI